MSKFGKLFWVLVAIVILGIIILLPGSIVAFIPKVLGTIVLVLATITLAIAAIVMLFRLELASSFILAIICIGVALGASHLIPAWFS